MTVAYVRLQGWNNPEGDDFFARQRATAADPGPKRAKNFYKMTQNIGKELQASSKAFTVPELRQDHTRV